MSRGDKCCLNILCVQVKKFSLRMKTGLLALPQTHHCVHTRFDIVLLSDSSAALLCRVEGIAPAWWSNSAKQRCAGSQESSMIKEPVFFLHTLPAIVWQLLCLQLFFNTHSVSPLDALPTRVNATTQYLFCCIPCCDISVLYVVPGRIFQWCRQWVFEE